MQLIEINSEEGYGRIAECYKKIIDSLLENEYRVPSENIPKDFDSSIIMFSKILRRRNCIINKKWAVVEGLKIDEKLKGGFEALKNALKTGVNIERFMTTNIDRPNSTDKMLDCDQIYHFHLSSEPHEKNNNFNKRTNERVFVYFDFDNTKAYFIDIYPHGAENNRVEEIIIKLYEKYPEICKNNIYEAKLSTQYKDSEISCLRKNNINPIFQVDENHIFCPGGGVTLNGVSIKDVFSKIYIVKYLKKLKKSIYELLKPIVKESDNIDIELYNKKSNVYIKIKVNEKIFKEEFLFEIRI